MKTLLISILIFSVTINLSALAKAPVWKVSKGDDYLYLGGTIHVLSKQDYPLPSAFETAYNNTDDIVLETDTAAMLAPDVQTEVLNAMSYQDHRALSNVLNRETYAALEALLIKQGVPIAVFDRFTPAGAMMTLTSFELQRLGLLSGQGVDVHFATRANSDKKDSLFFETFDEQLSFIKSMDQLDPNLVVKSGIEDIVKLESTWQELLSAWRSGDLATLETLGIVDMQRDFPNLYASILVSRNKSWMNDIRELMLTADKEFILVGVLHMAGKDGLIASLKAEGYTVEQLD